MSVLKPGEQLRRRATPPQHAINGAIPQHMEPKPNIVSNVLWFFVKMGEIYPFLEAR